MFDPSKARPSLRQDGAGFALGSLAGSFEGSFEPFRGAEADFVFFFFFWREGGRLLAEPVGLKRLCFGHNETSHLFGECNKQESLLEGLMLEI